MDSEFEEINYKEKMFKEWYFFLVILIVGVSYRFGIWVDVIVLEFYF